MFQEEYKQDPLRSVSTHSGTVVSADDIAFFTANTTRFDDAPSEVTIDILKKMQAVSTSVRMLSQNEDFQNLMWYMSQIKMVASNYAYNPTLDQSAKTIWFQQLSLVNGFEKIFNDFRALSPTHYATELNDFLEILKEELAEEENGNE